MNIPKLLVGRRPKPEVTIAVDCGALGEVANSRYSGTATLTETLLLSLAQIDKKNKYILYSFSPLPRYLMKKLGTTMKNQVLPRIGFKTIWLPLFFKIQSSDAFLAMSQIVPAYAPPTLGFIYDLAFTKYPTLYSNPDDLLTRTKELSLRAQHIITISESSRNDLLAQLDLKLKHVSLIYPGIRSIFTHIGPKIVDAKPFFLYVGGLRLTKNIPLALEAFYFFQKQHPNYRFLIIGEEEKPDKNIMETIEKHGLSQKVIFKRSVKTIDLPKYYRGAKALLFPSLYEGFGLPALESMACGCPVILSNKSSLPEIAGKAGIYCSDTNSEEITTAMTKIVEDRVYREKHVKLGIREAKRFDGRKFARQVLDAVYKYCI